MKAYFSWDFFVFILIFSSGIGGGLSAWAGSSESVITLPPTIIEGEVIENESAITKESQNSSTTLSTSHSTTSINTVTTTSGLPADFYSEADEDLLSSSLLQKKTTELKLEQPISAISGVGAKSMETSVNELGVPYFNMNREDDVAYERQLNSTWLLSPKVLPSSASLGFFQSLSSPSSSRLMGQESLPLSLSSSSFRQIHWEAAENYSAFRARIIKPKTKRDFNKSSDQQSNLSSFFNSSSVESGYSVEMGARRDRRWFEFRNHWVNPFESQNFVTERLRNFNDQSYFKIMRMNQDSDWLVNGDAVRRDVHLGSKVTGFTDTQQLSLSGRATLSPASEVVSYIKARRGDFESQRIINDSNHSQNRQIGALLKWRSTSQISKTKPSSSVTITSAPAPTTTPTISGSNALTSSLNSSSAAATAVTSPASSIDLESIASNSPNGSTKTSPLIDNTPLGSFLEIGLSNEQLKRDYRNQSHIQMDRYQLELLGTHKREISFLAVKGHLRSQAAQDKTQQSFSHWDSALNQPTRKQSSHQITEPLSLDTGIEVTTLSQSESVWNLGLKAQWRRYSLLPTPVQKFGDGMVLVGNDQLPLEEGTRVAAGMWFESQDFQVELLPFYEQTKNEPVILAVSPHAAKTMGLGSVYARGVVLQLRQELERWSIKFSYNYQEAINNSSIGWQRGHAIPGRPTHYIESSLAFGKPNQGVNFGMNYGYKSAEALDLTGLWRRAPYHNLKSFIGYGTRAWAVQLIGSQLLSSLNDTPLSLEQGMAGYDLMDPKIETQEYQLLCEFFL